MNVCLLQLGSNPGWKTAFTETFQSMTPSCAQDTHLWALTEVIKRILKLDRDNKRGTEASKKMCLFSVINSYFLPHCVIILFLNDCFC